ncbi:tetratricopeptide repeat protein [Rhodanobacter soli]|uniref:Tetratricopeptide (TPR) repeat protein n=1 Tax=Rhodanobacter soli TaxID=590609 RepID=A0ABV2PU04_9GAMM
MRYRLVLTPLLVLLLLGTAWIAYAPGLHGDFLFDDFGNLPALGAMGPVDNWHTFWRYITSGTADPTGRPLTLLTFLLDARNWPADPYPFKRTSLILHLLNGILLYALLARLGQLLAMEAPRRQAAALLGSALWLLHPLLVSTTLYIVQREAMLPATCVIAGLLTWLHGRAQLGHGRIPSGLVWSIVGVGGFTLLAVLAKANGALLPLYVLLIEIIVLAPRHPVPAGNAQRTYRGFLWTFVAIPTAAICAHITWVGIHGILTGGPDFRAWSIGQRLLTEPRVLMDYLSLLWLPHPFSSGLFNDQYVVSTSWLHPATTLPAIIVLLALLGSAWWLRQRHPAASLAILFYFAGQLIESTSLPLELYFEHRNYVPALLMFWPLGLWLTDTRTMPVLKRGLMIVLPLGLALMTHARAELWGNVHTQALLWAKINPDSARAQANAAQIEMQAGHPQDAIHRLEKLLATQPDQTQLAFNLIGARCLTGGISHDDIVAARKAMQGSANTGTLLAHWFDRTLPVAMSGECPGLTSEVLLDLINTGLSNPKLATAGPQQDLTYLRGRIALIQHQPSAAQADFIRALDLQVRPGMALEAAATLGAAGYPTQGLQLLDHYKQVQNQAMPPGFGMPMLHAWVLARQNYWPHELTHLRQQLTLDARAGNTNTAQPNPDAGATH